VGLTIYLARHAEAANPRDILYGRLPRVDLSARGREQAAALAEAMGGLPLQAIYSSPLLRARRTAAAIAAHHPGVSVSRSGLLLENRHPYQGRPHKEIAALGDRAYDPDVLGAKGESILDLRERMVRFLRQVSRHHRDGVVAAVAHADPLAALRAHLLGKEPTVASMRQEAPPLAAVFRVELSDEEAAGLEWFWKPPAPPAQEPRPEAAADQAAGSTGSPLPGEAAAMERDQLERAG
jgi:broad specificity phosphatase PhoE